MRAHSNQQHGQNVANPAKNLRMIRAMDRRPSILIVEDDRDLAAIVERFFDSEGFGVTTANSAEDAYDALTRHAFDALVLDINLPGADGIELCRNLRAASATPVVFASARAGDEARALALEGGGDAYLSKPFSLRELLAQVNAVLRRSDHSSRSEADARERGLALDPASRRVLRSGEPAGLSPKEYELAALLMRNPGTALSRERLLADVWGAFADVEPQTLAVHMRWLRSKLEDDPSHPTHFKTVRGFGYRYDPGGEEGRNEADPSR